MRRDLDSGYQLDDDPDRLDLDAIYGFLSTAAYWGRWRQRGDVALQIERSRLNVGAYDAGGAQVGYCRVLTDGLALAYLADVFVIDAHRGHGLGTAMVDFAVAHGPSWRWLLHTRDAGGLYAKFGFAAPPPTLMERPATS